MKKFATALFAFALICSVTAFAKDEMKKKAEKPKTLHGWVTDEKCAAKVAEAGHGDDEKCAQACAKAGSKMEFVNEEDKSIWTVMNPEALKGHEGHHVKISAHVYPDTKSIHVMGEPKMIADKKAKEKKG